MAKNFKINLNLVTPKGNFVKVTGPEKGKRANFDFVPGFLVLMVSTMGASSYESLTYEEREAMEKCLDVLAPNWRQIQENYKND